MYKKRFNNLRRKMIQQGLDQLVLSYPSNIYYLTGQWLNPGRRLIVLIISQNDAKLVVNQLVPVLPMDDVEVVFHSDWDDWINAVAVHIGNTGTVGLDMEWQVGFTFALMELKSTVKFVDGSNAINSLRMIKDETEIALMRASSRANDVCIKELIEGISPDLSEAELADHLYDIADKAGTDGYKGKTVLSYGVNAVNAHHTADSTRLKAGDNIVMDIGFGYKRYRSDMTRTVFYKKPSPLMKRVYEVVLKSQLAAIEAVRPGVALGMIDKVSRDIIKQEGFGQYFVHRTGHCIGLDVHEPPYVVGGNAMAIKPGMIFSIEPGVYIPGEGGVRIEDLVLATPEGYEVLNHYTKEMQVLF